MANIKAFTAELPAIDKGTNLGRHLPPVKACL